MPGPAPTGLAGCGGRVAADTARGLPAGAAMAARGDRPAVGSPGPGVAARPIPAGAARDAVASAGRRVAVSPPADRGGPTPAAVVADSSPPAGRAAPAGGPRPAKTHRAHRDRAARARGPPAKANRPRPRSPVSGQAGAPTAHRPRSAGHPRRGYVHRRPGSGWWPAAAAPDSVWVRIRSGDRQPPAGHRRCPHRWAPGWAGCRSRRRRLAVRYPMRRPAGRILP